MEESKVKHILLDSTRSHVIGVVYKVDGSDAGRDYIAAEKSSSLGFTTGDKALQWVLMVHKSQPLTENDGIYKMIPEDVKKEIAEILAAAKSAKTQ